jgi:aspartate racemase
MIESLLQLESLGAEIIVMPCNTAHFFYENISMFIHTPFLNMIEETAKHIKLDHKLDLKVGLLATKGTYVSHIYENVLLHYGIEVIIPDEEVQEIIMNLIYMVKSGIDDLTFIDINRVLNYFEARGVDRLILGCTELPVAFKRLNITKNLIDPTAILAKAAILASGGNIREL